MLTLHTTGGVAMMAAAREALAGKPVSQRPKLLGVTVLTSLDREQLRSAGMSGSPRQRAVRLALLARKAGLDGVVASAQEAAAIRRVCGAKFLIVVPGVRPDMKKDGKGPLERDDQGRVATPQAAIRAGADYLVVGRPILEAPDPQAAAGAIVDEISEALGA
jgi:orotidine-5'-phosphate decarboxylase